MGSKPCARMSRDPHKPAEQDTSFFSTSTGLDRLASKIVQGKGVNKSLTCRFLHLTNMRSHKFLISYYKNTNLIADSP